MTNLVEINLTGHGRGEVLIDGQKLDYVQGVSLSTKVNGINEVTITLLPAEIRAKLRVAEIQFKDSGAKPKYPAAMRCVHEV